MKLLEILLKKKNNLNLKQFTDLLKYFKDFSDENKLKINHKETLDISYNYDNNNFHTYRITINSIDEINKLMKSLHNKPNHIIFSILVSMILITLLLSTSFLKIKYLCNLLNSKPALLTLSS